MINNNLHPIVNKYSYRKNEFNMLLFNEIYICPHGQNRPNVSSILNQFLQFNNIKKYVIEIFLPKSYRLDSIFVRGSAIYTLSISKVPYN